MSLADDIGGLQVEDPEGDPIEIRSLWNEAPLGLVFLRHFG